MLRVHIHTRTHAHTRAHTHMHTPMRTHMQPPIHTHTCPQMHMCTCPICADVVRLPPWSTCLRPHSLARSLACILAHLLTDRLTQAVQTSCDFHPGPLSRSSSTSSFSSRDTGLSVAGRIPGSSSFSTLTEQSILYQQVHMDMPICMRTHICARVPAHRPSKAYSTIG